jgi:hypothetical protein
MQQKKIDDELEELRNDIITMYQDSEELEIQDYTLKIVYQDKKNYNESLIFDSLPDPQLWKNVSKVDSSKIAALINANMISEDMLKGTYTVTRVPYLYVHKQL